MSFEGKHAIVTGAGSGIGAALCRALVSAGAEVVCTDIDGGAAERTAAGLGAGARAARLDVTDAAAVQSAVDEVVNRAGRLDLMFNNAGIVWGGDSELLTLDQWNAIIDVNIRGVVHGVAAAYPLMVRQGHGHIVNTASMAGLTAAGQITSYVMSKHAVVGLSLALRSEAAAHGVGVLVVCPSAVETPILDKGAVGGFVGRNYFLQGQGVKTAYDPDRLARDTLRAIERNKALLVKPRRAHAQWVFARLAPGLMQRMSIRFIASPAGQPGAAPARRLAEQFGFPALQGGYGMAVAAMDTEFTLTQKRALAVATVIAIVFGAYFLRGYFILIVVARGGGVPVHAAVHPAQQAVRHGIVGDTDPAGGIRVGDCAAWACSCSSRSCRSPHGRESGRLGRADRPVSPRRSGAAPRQRSAAPGAVHRRHRSPRTRFGVRWPPSRRTSASGCWASCKGPRAACSAG